MADHHEGARADLLASLAPFLSTKEVAKLAGMSPKGLRHRVERGARPRPIKVVRRLRFPRGEVVDWLLSEGAP